MKIVGQATKAFGLADGWLNANMTAQVSGQTTWAGNLGTLGHYGDYRGCYWYPWITPVTTTTVRPIKLTLSEIERLRDAARADEKIKAILAKFTSQIEITVDFE